MIEKLSSFDLGLKEQAWSRSMWADELVSGLSIVSLLYKDKELAGFALWKLGPFGEFADLLKILIDYKFRGHGHGQELFRSGAKFILEYGARKVLLDVSVHNKKALKLYKLLNFKILAERKAYYSNGENAFLMELIIT